jgi:PAS domain S-box-containing protein
MALQRWGRAALWAGVAAGAALLGLVQWQRREAPDGLPDLLLVAGAVLTTGALCVLWAVRSRGRLLRDLAGQIRDLRERPSPQALHALAGRGPELALIVEQLEALSSCYRNALSELVQAREEAEQGRGPHEATDRIRPSGPRPLGATRQRMIARLAPNLHWVAATPPLLQLLGRGLTELAARSFLHVVHPEDAAGLNQSLLEALKDGEGHNITFRVLVPDAPPATAIHAEPPTGVSGTRLTAERHLQLDVLTIYSEAGRPLHLRCHLLDITERILTDRELRRRTEELSQANSRLRQINADLQRLKESYRDLYHHAPVHYFSLDQLGRFVACNESMLRDLGYPRGALLGQPYSRLLPPAALTAYRRDRRSVLRPGEWEAQWVKRDGSVIDVWIVVSVVRDRDGAFVHTRSVARDVTERKRLANDLKAKAEEVLQANVQLRRINQELEEFTYVVSHDLKEPLRTLEGFSHLLGEDYGDRLDAEGHEYIRHLKLASRRLRALIDDLLTLSRAGRVLKAPRGFSWDEAVHTVLGDLRDRIQRQQAQVQVEGPLPPALGDPERVMQLLVNLVGNALKYNPGASPQVTLGALPDFVGPLPAEGAEMATFFVRDNGNGIDPQYHEQIFKMFRRLHRREEVEGTGAGLAICKKIAEAHGGRIWVESLPGRGATFYFTLPRLRPGRARTEAARASRPTTPLPPTAVAVG